MDRIKRNASFEEERSERIITIYNYVRLFLLVLFIIGLTYICTPR